MTWGCFVKNSLIDSLFLENLSVFQWDFCVFWKFSIYGYLYWENWILERLPDDVKFVPKLSFNAENFPYIVSGTRHVCTKLCLRKHASWLCAQASWLCAQADSCVCMPRVWFYFFKSKFICSLKVVFSISTFFKSI